MKKKVFVHLDMDSVEAISEFHGFNLQDKDNRIFISSIHNSLNFFKQFNVKATYFVIARDLEITERLEAIKEVLKSGHNIASHSYGHSFLRNLSKKEKIYEISKSKEIIEDKLGVEVLGFRAPSYSIDCEVLEALCDVGYKYDSSIIPNNKNKSLIKINRLFNEPFEIVPEKNLLELPMPVVEPFGFPFHPSYSFVLGRLLHNIGLSRFQKNNNYLVYLFHNADFSDKPRLARTIPEYIYLNERSWKTKKKFLSAIFSKVLKNFDPINTENFVKNWPDSAPELNPKTILGISTTHETSACIVRDGKILSAISEERVSRVKLDSSFPPVRAIKEVIDVSKINPKSIDAVAISGLNWRALIPRTLESQKCDFFEFHGFNDYFPHFNKIFYRLYYLIRSLGYGDVSKYLKSKYGINPKVFYIEHHEAHAWSAYALGGEKKATVVTADGVGDDVSLTVGLANHGLIKRVYQAFYPHSLGQFYTSLTQYLGFIGGRHEGKVTGLAAYGKASDDLIKKINKTLIDSQELKLNKKYYSEGFVRNINFKKLFKSKKFNIFRQGFGQSDALFEYRNFKPPLKKILKNHSKEDLANAYQKITEDKLFKIILNNYKKDFSHLRLAGGVMANVKINHVLSKKLSSKSVFIFPNMGDGGLSVGAAFAIKGKIHKPLSNVYLGRSFSDKNIIKALNKKRSLEWKKPKNLEKEVALLLKLGKVVARFDERMEFGPRALGNRSILYFCNDVTVNDWLNKKLNRTEFMPFAPICLYEDADLYFNLREGEKHACQFMTMVAIATKKMKNECPAAVHVDGTCRPQLIKKETNPKLYKLIHEYKKLTGISCLINTSLNLHEEPIVNSPDDAIKAFVYAKLDFLLIGQYLVNSKKIK